MDELVVDLLDLFLELGIALDVHGHVAVAQLIPGVSRRWISGICRAYFMWTVMSDRIETDTSFCVMAVSLINKSGPADWVKRADDGVDLGEQITHFFLGMTVQTGIGCLGKGVQRTSPDPVHFDTLDQKKRACSGHTPSSMAAR